MSNDSTNNSDRPRSFPNVDRLLRVMEQLRDPQSGCPWDKQQTFESIVPHTIEEAYEVADAIENGDMQDVKDELGDLLFQIVFYAQLGVEQNHFDFEAIAGAVADKLIRRHPHVFANQAVDDLELSWEAIKRQEREEKGGLVDGSILANVPKGLPPITRAHKLQTKCAKVGFDWPDVAPVLAKVEEELDEVKAELKTNPLDQNRIEEEIGDLLFAIVNLSRHAKVDAYSALRKANAKFEKRFRAVENDFSEKNVSLQDASLEEMEAVWQSIKQSS
ncbi:MAG: nucleoside triphosphate pyrophosphohydrolase [Aliiglaciecola sp.]